MTKKNYDLYNLSTRCILYIVINHENYQLQVRCSAAIGRERNGSEFSGGIKQRVRSKLRSFRGPQIVVLDFLTLKSNKLGIGNIEYRSRKKCFKNVPSLPIISATNDRTRRKYYRTKLLPARYQVQNVVSNDKTTIIILYRDM